MINGLDIWDKYCKIWFGVVCLLVWFFVGLGFNVVISWNCDGNFICFVVWDIVIIFVFIGLCSELRILCLNLGNLFKNNMLLCVNDILLGFGFDDFFISVIVE